MYFSDWRLGKRNEFCKKIFSLNKLSLCYIDLGRLSITVEGNQTFVTKLYCYVGIEEVRKYYTSQQYKPDEKKKTLQELLDLLSRVTTNEQTV